MQCPCGSDKVIKRGFYRPRSNRYQPIKRWYCKTCRITFSRQTNSVTKRQRKPWVNQEVLRWYSSGVTQRRMAITLGVNRKTIVTKFLFMAHLARKEHERRIAAGELKTSYVQFDEMEAFEHTRMKPLSIALAVRGKTGEILEAQVAPMNCKGKLAKISQSKYGWREDFREVALADMLATVKACAKPGITLMSDGGSSYPRLVRECIPGARHVATRSPKRKLLSKVANRSNDDSSMFTLNYVSAKIRHDLSRMARKSWVTTKKMSRLQAHLDLYIAYNNGYKLG